MFQGSIPALITPMFEDGRVDYDAFEAFVDWQINQGSHGLVPVGTTGESPTLSHDEHKKVVEVCVKVAAGRVPVMAGAGSNSTVEAVDFAKHAEAVGADGVLVVTPYYNKPSQAGMMAHFAAVHGATDLPIFIYNIPGRSVVDMSVETMRQLAELPRIVGVKDATGDLARVSLTRAALGPDFVQLSGEDATAVGFNAMGGVGCISVSANVAPALCAEMQTACLEGRYADAVVLQDRLSALHTAMFIEPSPAPAKYGASLLGRAAPHVRLPILPLTEAGQVRVASAIAQAGISQGLTE